MTDGLLCARSLLPSIMHWEHANHFQHTAWHQRTPRIEYVCKVLQLYIVDQLLDRFSSLSTLSKFAFAWHFYWFQICLCYIQILDWLWVYMGWKLGKMLKDGRNGRSDLKFFSTNNTFSCNTINKEPNNVINHWHSNR